MGEFLILQKSVTQYFMTHIVVLFRICSSLVLCYIKKSDPDWRTLHLCL